eukprot:m.459629 g.459629  ORF g.459629 m.459629 type:complete len:384 (+) comp21794_c0_seq1:1-1152(+)
MNHTIVKMRLMWWAVVGLAAAQQPRERRVFQGKYGDTVAEHTRFGRELGAMFSEDIAITLATSKKEGTLSIIAPFVQTAAGRSNFSIMLKNHNETFPNYIAEIAGMAEGAGVNFDDLLALNLGESLSTIADPWLARETAVEHCSEYSLWPYNAHNEDGDLGDMNTSYWVDIDIDGSHFTAFVYCGQLPSGAFGWNAHSVAFTLNYLSPYAVDVHGIGRNFISRDLLRATNMADAVRRATVSHPHATGHNFQLLSFSEGLLSNVEAAPHGLFKVTNFEKGTPASFHANSYIHLTLAQYVSESSKHRLARAAALPVPSTPAEMLSVLGDQADAAQPIFHDDVSTANGDRSGMATLTTVLFDLTNRTVVEYFGNPKNLDVLQTWRL